MQNVKIILYLKAKANHAYPSRYHRDMHGMILHHVPDKIIEQSKQGETDDPLGISFTQLLPWRDIEKGDTRKIVINSTTPEIAKHIVKSLSTKSEIHIGELTFDIQGVDQAVTEVGDVGTTGTIESDTGILVSIPPDRTDEFEISNPGEYDYYWSEDDPVNVFNQRIKENLETKWSALHPDSNQGPQTLNGPIFTQQELLKTYSLPIKVSQNHTETVVLSKWRFKYEIRNKAHKNTLNLALGAGLGEKNNFSLGTVSLTGKQEPYLTTPE